MSAGRGRIAGSLGANDPRNRRRQSLKSNEDVQIGTGLVVDRDGRLSVARVASVADLPDGYTLADVATTLAAVLDALKRGDIMEA